MMKLIKTEHVEIRAADQGRVQILAGNNDPMTLTAAEWFDLICITHSIKAYTDIHEDYEPAPGEV